MTTIKNILIAGCVCCGIAAATASCRENEYGTVDLTMPENQYTPIAADFSYSGVTGLYTTADFQRVRQALANGTAPAAVQQEFQNLKNSSLASKSRKATPHVQIVRGDPTGTTENTQNYGDAMRDAAAAYQMAMLWLLTDDADYAATASKILIDWAQTCTTITSNDADFNLAAGAQGYTFALAGQMLMGYDGWTESQKTAFKNWMKNVFGKTNREFLDNHAKGTSFQNGHKNVDRTLWDEHYWSNWDMVTMASYMAIGILCEDDDMVNFVVNYFYSGAGNGCIKKLIRGTHTDPLGTGETLCQNQESGRDQGHAQMSLAVCAHLCQMAYSLYQQNPSVKELDFFAADDNAVLKMAEYVALSNLRNGTDDANKTGSFLVTATQMPFTEYHHCPGASSATDDNLHTQLSETDRGGARPGWEIILAHYKSLGSGFVYTKQMADKIRPEGGAGEPANRYGMNSGAFDQIGWNTLMLYK
ncbi:MAG: alginate lyase family protein [Prevotella sp.]|nr:alginate lyase family protein [Prevotella sp.]